jgi:hypothetical protein
MAVTPNSLVTTQGVGTAQAVCTAAKTAPYSGTTNTVLLFTAGANGSLVKKLKAIPRDTVTATQCQLYLSKDSGVTMSLLNMATMAAYTAAATTSPTPTDFGYTAADPLRLSATDRLYVAIGVALANGIQFIAETEDF